MINYSYAGVWYLYNYMPMTSLAYTKQAEEATREHLRLAFDLRNLNRG